MNADTHDFSGRQILETIKHADKFNKWLYTAIHPYIKGEILEIGSGIGNISSYLLKNANKVSLSDTEPGYIEILGNEFKGNPHLKGLFNIDLNAPYFSAEYQALLRKFDSIIAINVLEHIKDDKAAIKNINMLLKPGGRIIILTPAYSFLYSRLDKELGHYRRYTRSTLKSIFKEAGINVHAAFHFNALGIIAWAYAKIRRFRSVPKKEMKAFNFLVPAGRLIDRILFQNIGLSVIIIGDKKSEI